MLIRYRHYSVSTPRCRNVLSGHTSSIFTHSSLVSSSKPDGAAASRPYISSIIACHHERGLRHDSPAVLHSSDLPVAFRTPHLYRYCRLVNSSKSNTGLTFKHKQVQTITVRAHQLYQDVSPPCGFCSDSDTWSEMAPLRPDMNISNVSMHFLACTGLRAK